MPLTRYRPPQNRIIEFTFMPFVDLSEEPGNLDRDAAAALVKVCERGWTPGLDPDPNAGQESFRLLASEIADPMRAFRKLARETFNDDYYAMMINKFTKHEYVFVPGP